jgi:3-oxoadipate enol-lactonase
MKKNINGITCNYEISGSGPWVTLSHSLACDLGMWDGLAEELARHFSVLRYDTRGHGLSSAPVGAYTLSELATDLAGLFQALNIHKSHFIGLSMGGMIGQTFAIAYPGILKTLVLADTTSRRPENALEMWAERVKNARNEGMEALVESTLARWFTEPFRIAQPLEMDRIGNMIRNTPVDGFAGCCNAISRIDVLDQLNQIECPALVMVGEHDHATTPWMAQQMQAALRDAELIIIPSAAHLSNVEQPYFFNQAVLKFLKQYS